MYHLATVGLIDVLYDELNDVKSELINHCMPRGHEVTNFWLMDLLLANPIVIVLVCA